MNPLQIAAGLVAGIVGAAIWAAIGYYANMEVGYVAWGIGGLVGVAVAAAGKNGVSAGIVAVLITVASLCAGKYASVELALSQFGSAEETMNEIRTNTTDNDFTMALASMMLREKIEAGAELEWPAGKFPENVESKEDLPKGVWVDAKKAFTEMEEEPLNQFREACFKSIEEDVNASWDDARENGFKESFSMFDLIFFGLGIATAWGIANSDENQSVESVE